jgi:hypothetical protein
MDTRWVLFDCEVKYCIEKSPSFLISVVVIVSRTMTTQCIYRWFTDLLRVIGHWVSSLLSVWSGLRVHHRIASFTQSMSLLRNYSQSGTLEGRTQQWYGMVCAKIEC